MVRGLGEVLRNPRLHLILALNFCNYACTFTVQGLWGGPFLREVHGLFQHRIRQRPAGAVIAYQVGMLVCGPLDRVLDTRKWIAIAGTSVIAAILGGLALEPSAAMVANHRHRRHRLPQRLQHHDDDPRPRHIPRQADRPRHGDHEHQRHAGGRLHAEPVGHHPRRLRAAARRRAQPRRPIAPCLASCAGCSWWRSGSTVGQLTYARASSCAPGRRPEGPTRSAIRRSRIP